jgi:hypothetical protein
MADDRGEEPDLELNDLFDDEEVGVEFTYIMECDVLLDDVVARLADVGVKIEPWQRVVVSRWLDMFSEHTCLPLKVRLAMLHGMLRGSRCPAP